MQKYEILYIINPKVTEKEQKEIQSKMKQLITNNKGKIQKEEALGKKKFAYPIRSMRHGFYNLIEFEIEPSEINELDAKIKLIELIVRHFMMKEEKNKEESLKKQKERKEKYNLAFKKTLKKEEVKEKPLKEKTDLKELDKKLEKILDEDIIK